MDIQWNKIKFNTHDGMSGAGNAWPVGRFPIGGGAPPPGRFGIAGAGRPPVGGGGGPRPPALPALPTEPCNTNKSKLE